MYSLHDVTTEGSSSTEIMVGWLNLFNADRVGWGGGMGGGGWGGQRETILNATLSPLLRMILHLHGLR